MPTDPIDEIFRSCLDATRLLYPGVTIPAQYESAQAAYERVCERRRHWEARLDECRSQCQRDDCWQEIAKCDEDIDALSDILDGLEPEPEHVHTRTFFHPDDPAIG